MAHPPPPPPPPAAIWQLVWHDEFEANAVDRQKWEFEVNAWGGGNNELQYYTDRPENVSVRDGMLRITARKETYTGPDGTRHYTSARLRTKHLGDWRYGRFEVRARLPRGRGIWPAIWMLPSDNTYGTWAASGEIDIMELVGDKPDEILGYLHYGGSWPANTSSGIIHKRAEGDFCSDFHVFAVEWEQTEIRWYVDGLHFQTQKDWHSTNAPYPAPFDQHFHLLLNVAVGGKLPGNPDDSTSFPQTMEVDYVRVFQRTP